jgi:hypothetical protein
MKLTAKTGTELSRKELMHNKGMHEMKRLNVV